MSQTLAQLPSPAVLIDSSAMEHNLARMQAVCDRAGVELWPHIKTHKLVPILRRQLELGAKGATCAKLGEAEALLPSGVRRIFIAHSLSDRRHAARLKALHGQLDQLILAVTSDAQFSALEALLTEADLSVPVLLAVNTGLNREGVRTPEHAAAVAAKIRASSRMHLLGLYTHEGHAYGSKSPEEAAATTEHVHATLMAHREAIGGDLPLWPGCSVTAALMAGRPAVQVVRPGSYVFGDLSLTETTGIMTHGDAALTILSTVVDRPEPGLALTDAGSKVFSGDKTRTGLSGRAQDRPSLTVSKVSEEHGFITGEGVDALTIGDRIRFQPAHVCPVLNLASRVYLVEGNVVKDTWTVDARGRSD